MGKEVRTKRIINKCIVSLVLKRTLLEDAVKKVLKCYLFQIQDHVEKSYFKNIYFLFF